MNGKIDRMNLDSGWIIIKIVTIYWILSFSMYEVRNRSEGLKCQKKPQIYRRNSYCLLPTFPLISLMDEHFSRYFFSCVWKKPPLATPYKTIYLKKIDLPSDSEMQIIQRIRFSPAYHTFCTDYAPLCFLPPVNFSLLFHFFVLLCHLFSSIVAHSFRFISLEPP